jgi:hypothetical protein
MPKLATQDGYFWQFLQVINRDCVGDAAGFLQDGFLVSWMNTLLIMPITCPLSG